MIQVVVPDVIEVGELGADAAEIVPDAGQNGFDLFRRFFREGGLEILAADPVLTQPAADEAGSAAEQIGGLDRIEIARGAQQRDRQRADRGFRHRLGGVAKARLGAKEQAVHGCKRRAGQAGSRVRISTAFWPPKPNEFDMTAVTRASRAVLGTTSKGIAGSGTS